MKPGLTGAVVGAVALAIVGFTWGGWVTGGSAKDMAAKASNAAVATALTPYCVERGGAADAAMALTELKAASTYSRKGLVEKAGWAPGVIPGLTRDPCLGWRGGRGGSLLSQG